MAGAAALPLPAPRRSQSGAACTSSSSRRRFSSSRSRSGQHLQQPRQHRRGLASPSPVPQQDGTAATSHGSSAAVLPEGARRPLQLSVEVERRLALCEAAVVWGLGRHACSRRSGRRSQRRALVSGLVGNLEVFSHQVATLLQNFDVRLADEDEVMEEPLRGGSGSSVVASTRRAALCRMPQPQQRAACGDWPSQALFGPGVRDSHQR